jgi:hypothetical protein
MKRETLLNYLGPHRGLNSDWSVEAWPLGKGLWILDAEDGTFALVHRRATDHGLFEIMELATITPEATE